jgi:hypothetical protein
LWTYYLHKPNQCSKWYNEKTIAKYNIFKDVISLNPTLHAPTYKAFLQPIIGILTKRLGNASLLGMNLG